MATTISKERAVEVLGEILARKVADVNKDPRNLPALAYAPLVDMTPVFTGEAVLVGVGVHGGREVGMFAGAAAAIEAMSAIYPTHTIQVESSKEAVAFVSPTNSSDVSLYANVLTWRNRPPPSAEIFKLKPDADKELIARIGAMSYKEQQDVLALLK